MSVLYLKNNQGIWEEVSTINGHTPVITASKSNGITTIYADGTTVATINDGEKGEKGEDGETPLSAFPNDTASGQIVHITDGADDIPMESVKVNIEPVQDLHGQDAPYPAGGGKNLLPFPYTIGSERTVNGVTATVSSDGIVTLNGTATAQAEFPLIATYIDLPVGTYTLSGLPSGGGTTTFVYNAYAFDENSTNLFDYRVPSSRTVTASNPIKRLYIYIRIIEGYTANNLVVKPQFESGSTATDYAPYSNICPISGWTGANVSRTGKNLFDIEKFLKRDNIAYEKDGDSFTFTPKQSMYSNPWRFAKKDSVISASVQSLTNITSSGIKLRFLNDSGTTVFTLNESTNSVKNIVASRIRVDWGTMGQTKITAPQIEFGAENTSYEPYTGSTYPITFPSETGTVYGGELDVTNGTLTVDRAMVTFDGSESWNIQSINSYGIANFYTSVDHYPAANFRSLCNMLPPQTSLIGETKTEGYFVHQNGATVYIRIFSSRASTVAELMTWLASNPIQLVYKLAEPIVYQLTPTEIKSLYGDNNIYADCGSTSVTYRADTTSYIGKIITATKSGTVTTVYVKDKPIATINDGTNGKDYTLTTQDKADIAQQVINILPTAQGVSF